MPPSTCSPITDGGASSGQDRDLQLTELGTTPGSCRDLGRMGQGRSADGGSYCTFRCLGQGASRPCSARAPSACTGSTRTAVTAGGNALVLP